MIKIYSTQQLNFNLYHSYTSALMHATLIGESKSLLVRLYAAEDGVWHVHVEGVDINDDLVLAPATFVVNIWRANDARILRGTIQLHGSSHTAPVQTNNQLLEMLNVWLHEKRVVE